MPVVIETRALKKYYGRSRGIESVDISVEQGEIYGFIGPNGAGKSTTIRTLLGFIRPTAGEAQLLGAPCTDASLSRVKRRIGYLPAEVSYYDNMKVRELLRLSAAFYKNGAQERIRRLTDYFELETDRPVNALSFGNRKKVGIVQCLLHDPELLILDEPTGGLDPLMQNRFFEFLREEHKRGKTIFFSSHVLSEVQKFCERVAIIRDGVVISVERMDALTGSQYKKVGIVARADAPAAPPALDGVKDLRQEGQRTSFLYNGSMNALISALSSMDVEDFWVEEPDLEEVFMHYYRKDADEDGTVQA